MMQLARVRLTGHTQLPKMNVPRVCWQSMARILALRAPTLARGAARRCYATTHLDLPALDRKWQQRWQSLRQSRAPSTAAADGSDNANDEKSTYVLAMFPYPSGQLHMGHLRVYSIADVMARFRTLQGGGRVLLPMGWDAFGLPAENAAIEHGINPAVWTRGNIERMKEQLGAMNGSWDWEDEISTCDPEFYKHTQKIFLMLHEKGLAYQDEAEVNYDPVDKTVVANEQVDANGCSWRSGTKVEKRRLKQWFLRISAFREELLQGLDQLAEGGAWPERVLAMQKNWLGKSHGALVQFPLMAFQHDVGAHIEVYTTRPDTLFGVQYLALAPTHPIVLKLAAQDPELQAFLDTLPGLPPDSKVGYLLPHIRAINPLAYHDSTPTETKQSIPVYIAAYVLGDYGEGAVMGVPGHDPRDHAFWREHHYDEPIRVVLSASDDESTTAMLNEPFVDHGVMTAHSGPYQGKHSTEAGKMMVAMLEDAGLAKSVEKWRLRDWLISRQRYWGTPIPIVHCASCGPVPVPDEQLPVELPDVRDHWTGKKAGNPLMSQYDWVSTPCPKCGEPARRDTDTMDTFVDSSWYYMRFIDAHNKGQPFSADKVKKLLPVDLYIGGIEHAILHLLYARFIYKFLMQSPLASTDKQEGLPEPFRRLITQGMVQGRTYKDPANGRFLKPDEVDASDPSNPVIVATGERPDISFEKMSKSKHNGVEPTDLIARYGADATRAYVIFQAPVGDMLNWDEEKISGVTRWLHKLHDLAAKVGKGSDAAGAESAKDYLEKRMAERGHLSVDDAAQLDADAAVWREVQKTITSVTASYEKVYAMNTVVSHLMILTNTVSSHFAKASQPVLRDALSALIRMAAPIIPAVSEECWALLHPSSQSVFSEARFPVTDGTLSILQLPTQNCAVQVNGKLKLVVEIPAVPHGLEGNELQDWVVGEVMKVDGPKAKLGDLSSAKTVRVVRGGKLVNFVL